ncbi:MAG: S-layer homology domain-containing protein, partial [Firmicutes bacterium]|nr:S-layer homology domain-containing protein [Bacillota bacterium]
MKKRIFSVLLAVLMLCSLPMTVMAEGLASGLLIMPASAFTDVPADAWYAADVNTAVALGLVNGRSADTYAPGGNLKYSEAVKLAACMHQ